MKRLLLILALALPMLTGCSSLFPKRVEFGQDKIEKFPLAKPSEREVQRQAAQRAAEKAAETLDAALIDGASASVVDPAKEVVVTAGAVARSLGPPISPAPISEPSEALARKLDRAIAKLNQRIDDFREDNDKNIGKKVEGTGWLSVPYFLWIGLVGVFVFVVWIVLKTVVNVAAAGSPPVALGLSAVRAGGKLASAAVGQLVAGGERFKGWLKTETPELSEEVRKKIEDLFTSAHKESSDSAVRELVDKLTKKG